MRYGSAPSLLGVTIANVNTQPAEPRDWRRTPPQLREGIHNYLALARAHPHVHPAVLAAVMASPADQRRRLLDEAARRGEREDGGPRCSPSSSPSSSSDEIWEDAVEDLDAELEASSPAPTMAMASVVTDAEAEAARLEREAADCHRRWQSTRQLAYWTRYNECRARVEALRGRGGLAGVARAADEERERAMRDTRWSQLHAQRQVHERRLAELGRRRERLRWTRQYDEQTRLYHSQLARRQLQEELRQLDERAQVRRLEHIRRVQQLTMELSADEERESALESRSRKKQLKQSSAVVVVQSPPTPPSSEPEDEFTHVWDDFSHWEKMVSDDKDSVPVEASPRKGALALSLPQLASTLGNMRALTTLPERAASAPNVPGLPGQAALWRADQPTTPFEERKKWFEEALLAWHAQDDEEDFGTSQYARKGVIGHPRGSPSSGSEPAAQCATGPLWFHAAWSAWQGPSVLFN